jgi:hypothetical protein
MAKAHAHASSAQPPHETADKGGIPNADLFGVDSREEKHPCITQVPMSHVLGNAYERIKGRRSNLISGAKMEVASVVPTLVLATLPSSHGSNGVYVAITASAAIASVLALRIWQNHKTLKELAKVAQSYRHTDQDPPAHHKAVAARLLAHDIHVDETPLGLTPDELTALIDEARAYGSRQKNGHHSKRSRVERLTHGFKASGAFASQLGHEMLSAPQQLPRVFKNAAIGAKDVLLSIPYGPAIWRNTDTQNATLYTMLVGTFCAEAAFEGAHLIEGVHNITHGNMLASSLNAMSFLLAATPLLHLAEEVSRDFKKLAHNPQPLQDAKRIARKGVDALKNSTEYYIAKQIGKSVKRSHAYNSVAQDPRLIYARGRTADAVNALRTRLFGKEEQAAANEHAPQLEAS